MHTCVHTHRHTYMHTYMQTYMHTYMLPIAREAETNPNRHSILSKGQNRHREAVTSDMKRHWSGKMRTGH